MMPARTPEEIVRIEALETARCVGDLIRACLRKDEKFIATAEERLADALVDFKESPS